MSLKLYNTMTRKEEVFTPAHEAYVTMYNCGPTVYNYPHIGNYRAYIFADVLRRVLEYSGFTVKQVMNITDVDDKTIRDSQKENIPLKEFTGKYEQAFMEDIAKLNVLPASQYPRATEHVKEMEHIIETLLEKEIAYKGSDGSIYFNIKKFPKYGKLTHLDLSQLKEGARVSHDEYDKLSASDFVLWKARTEEDGGIYWGSPWGEGRPGWHIECSAMSEKYLGLPIDIHTGGVDNMFPHHENEIAQTEASHDCTFVKYWMHCEHLLVDGKKMSKSLGNFYTLEDLLSKGHSPRAIRYVLLAAHYRTQLNFTLEAILAAQNTIQRFDDFIARLRRANGTKSDKKIATFMEAKEAHFRAALEDDLNVPGALAEVFDFMRGLNDALENGTLSSSQSEKAMNILERFDSVLGVMNFEVKEIDPVLESYVKDRVEEREKAKKEKNYALADAIREELKGKGITLEDTKNGVVWKIA